MRATPLWDKASWRASQRRTTDDHSARGTR